MRAQSGLLHYLHPVLDVAELKNAVDRVTTAVLVLDRRFRFDAIACRGNSGITVSSIVCHRLGKPLCIVRKPGEVSHGNGVECGVAVARYVIVDDFVSSGATVEAILDAIRHAESEDEPKADCVAIVTYRVVPEQYETVRGIPVVVA